VLVYLGRPAATPAPARAPELQEHEPVEDVPVVESSLDRGLRDIRRNDRGFDPSRFVGYIGMVFRMAQRAWMSGDLESLRDRLTPEMYDAMHAERTRLVGAGRVNVVGDIDITAMVTEAWQERERDYLTAHIRGSIIDYTVDEAAGTIVAGSKTIPRDVEEFWTFARPAGLNFWMLSAIQT